MRARVRSEIGGGGPVDADELHLAGNALAAAVANVESDDRGPVHFETERPRVSCPELQGFRDRGTPHIRCRDLVGSGRQLQAECSAGVRIGGKRIAGAGDLDPRRGNRLSPRTGDRPRYRAGGSLTPGHQPEGFRGRSTHREEALEGDLFPGLQLERIRWRFPDPAECVPHLVGRVDGVGDGVPPHLVNVGQPVNAVGGGNPVGGIGFVAERRLDEQPLPSVLKPEEMALVQPAVARGGNNGFDTRPVR